MEKLTSLERCLRAIRFQPPDRVPVVPQAHVWSLYHCGSTSEECMMNGSLYAELQLKALSEFGWDGIFIATDSVALAHSLGAPVELTAVGVAPSSRGLLEDLEQVRDLKAPDPRETRLNEWIVAAGRLVKEVGRDVLIIARADQGPFSLGCQIRGMQDFLTELGYGDRAEDIHRLLRFSTEVVWRFAELLLETGAHVVSIGDALASGSLISPEMFEEYAFPYQQEIARRVRKKGGMLSIHVCGRTTGSIHRLAESGANIVEFDALTEFDTAMDAARGKTCLLGNVETSDILALGSPDDVRRECLWRMQKMEGKGGYILSSGCALSPNTPAENIRAMVQTAREWKYS